MLKLINFGTEYCITAEKLPQCVRARASERQQFNEVPPKIWRHYIRNRRDAAYSLTPEEDAAVKSWHQSLTSATDVMWLKMDTHVFCVPRVLLERCDFFADLAEVRSSSGNNTEHSALYLDRDARAFAHILCWLRDPAYAVPKKFAYETNFYGIHRVRIDPQKTLDARTATTQCNFSAIADCKYRREVEMMPCVPSKIDHQRDLQINRNRVFSKRVKVLSKSVESDDSVFRVQRSNSTCEELVDISTFQIDVVPKTPGLLPYQYVHRVVFVFNELVVFTAIPETLRCMYEIYNLPVYTYIGTDGLLRVRIHVPMCKNSKFVNMGPYVDLKCHVSTSDYVAHTVPVQFSYRSYFVYPMNPLVKGSTKAAPICQWQNYYVQICLSDAKERNFQLNFGGLVTGLVLMVRKSGHIPLLSVSNVTLSYNSARVLELSHQDWVDDMRDRNLVLSPGMYYYKFDRVQDFSCIDNIDCTVEFDDTIMLNEHVNVIFLAKTKNYMVETTYRMQPIFNW